jgi:hypothetical protein
MRTTRLDTPLCRCAYEEAFDELWQQTCLGRFSVTEVKERLLALQQRLDPRPAGAVTKAPPRQARG